MAGERWYQALRAGFAALTLAAILTQLAIGMDKPGFRPGNFFSFFTIQSNILAALVLLASAAIGLRRITLPDRWDLVRGAAVVFMATTGIVYDVLLADIQADLQLTEPWVDWVLHRLMPVVMALDWLLAPPARRLTWRGCLVWMLYPLVYGVFSLVRGPLVDWYPYPFLDPRESGGYPAVAAYMVAIAIVFSGLVWIVATLGNLARSWWAERTAQAEAAA